jgi:hypothetical protein
LVRRKCPENPVKNYGVTVGGVAPKIFFWFREKILGAGRLAGPRLLGVLRLRLVNSTINRPSAKNGGRFITLTIKMAKSYCFIISTSYIDDIKTKSKVRTSKRQYLITVQGLRHRIRGYFSWMMLSAIGIPLLVAVLALGSFVALPSSRLQDLPSGPTLKLGQALQNIAITLNFAPPVPEPESTTQQAKTAVAKKGKAPGGIAANKPQSGVQGRFYTLPPGSALPSDAECSSRVRSAAEVRPANGIYNSTKGVGGSTEFPRVTGNFSGTTDEIFQWTACKWGIDEDIVRAQAAKESWWFHRVMGDLTTNAAHCWPVNNTLDSNGKCPESVGIMQVRYQYHNSGLAVGTYSPYYSTAYNADYTYAVWRDCYEGNMTWLNNVDKGATYAAGDEWGCVGEWFSGRWYTPATLPYIDAVKNYLNQRIWETPNFLAAT